MGEYVFFSHDFANFVCNMPFVNYHLIYQMLVKSRLQTITELAQWHEIRLDLFVDVRIATRVIFDSDSNLVGGWELNDVKWVTDEW